VAPDVAQASRLHGLGIGHPFLVPTRCVRTRKLRAAEGIRPVSPFAYTSGLKLGGGPAYPVRPGGRLLWPLPTVGHGVRKPSGRWRSQPVWDRRHLVGSRDYRYVVGPSGLLRRRICAKYPTSLESTKSLVFCRVTAPSDSFIQFNVALYGFQTGARLGLNLGVGRQRPRNSVGSFGNPHRRRAIS